MNTEILTAGISPGDSSDVFNWFQEIEGRFSRFAPESELSQVNRCAGAPIQVSEQFFVVLQEALNFYEETEGIFSPFLGELMNRIGYSQSFEYLKEQNHAINKSPWRDTLNVNEANKNISVDHSNRTITINKHISLDFGGFAKGWSVQQISMALIERSIPKGIIDAGGDIFAWNENWESEPWEIGVVSPYSDQETLAKLLLKRQAGIATSSKIKRSWLDTNGQSFHHIIDPRTSLPAASDCVQATVVGPDLLSAEVYAKCLLILGTQAGPPWLEKHRQDLSYIMVDLNNHILASSKLNQVFCKISY